MKFADFHAGQVIDAGPYEVDEDEMIRFATAYDPQWFHTDPERAAQGPFEGLIASGWHSCGIAMRLVVDRVLHDSESFASPGLKYLKWLQPVRPGDSLSLRLTVLEARRSGKRPDLGILEWRWQLRNQHDSEVLELEVTSMFKLKAE
ncbi:MAG TPA: MaoC family dehydratase [Gammaproteobacteria bacterium]|nr:MaoC family dehydratase [Gammaproteobacteria bacterium]